jgi:hypothetical protein
MALVVMCVGPFIISSGNQVTKQKKIKKVKIIIKNTKADRRNHISLTIKTRFPTEKNFIHFTRRSPLLYDIVGSRSWGAKGPINYSQVPTVRV